MSLAIAIPLISINTLLFLILLTLEEIRKNTRPSALPTPAATPAAPAATAAPEE